MGREDKKGYWIQSAEYDIQSARAMHKARRLLYVGFLCHQTAEKALKAYHCFRKDEDPLYTHNLLLLSEKSGLLSLLSTEHTSLLNDLMPLNIQTRYPSGREEMMKSLSLQRWKGLMRSTEEFFQWIKTFWKQ